ncbi:MAG: DUF1924 domain-containing protein [Campylobacteraceae bacterium]|nr:DUF1924 domain-containing protein [Campylobacteraceae bacterium]
MCAFGFELNAEMKAYCVSSHGNNLSQKAQNIFTGKDINSLAPSVNEARLSDAKEVKTMANCSACNKKADNGVFSKKRLKYLLMVLGETSEVFRNFRI